MGKSLILVPEWSVQCWVFFPKQECKGGNYFELLLFTDIMHRLQGGLRIQNLWALLSNLLAYQKGWSNLPTVWWMLLGEG